MFFNTKKCLKKLSDKAVFKGGGVNRFSDRRISQKPLFTPPPLSLLNTGICKTRSEKSRNL
jgi:hypothetical protein